MNYRALVLFDIDGTLIRRAGPHHREALAEGIRCVTGFDTTTQGIPVQGMLDPDIVRSMMRNVGAADGRIELAMSGIINAAERHYLNVCPSLRSAHCPGVEPLLRMLTRQGILLGLVTGNFTRIGWRKLQRAGLRRYFRLGAFGEMAKTRAGLVRRAIGEARRRGWIGRGTPVSLVGDAPADIIAARANLIRIISVKTGITAPEELHAHGPDYLLPDLRHLRLGMLL